MEQNKTGKYFKYAIGEIVLVVIGILIALQINNWNEDRQKNNQEQMIMISMKEELQQNLKSLDKSIIRINSLSASTNTILNILNKTNKREFTAFQFDSILGKTIIYPSFFPSSIILNELNNSGKISSLNNDVFRKSLYEWNTMQQNLNQASVLSNKSFYDYLKYLKDNALYRNIDDTDKHINVGKSILLKNNFYLLKNVQFENYLEDYHTVLSVLRSQYKIAKTLIEKTITNLENQLK